MEPRITKKEVEALIHLRRAADAAEEAYETELRDIVSRIGDRPGSREAIEELIRALATE